MRQKIIDALISLGLVVLFVAVFLGIGFAGSRLQHALGMHGDTGREFTAVNSLIGSAFNLLCCLVATGVIALIRRRSLLDFGLRDGGWWRRAGWGVVVGAVAFAVLAGALVATGGMTVRLAGLGATTAVTQGLLWGACFVLVGLFEETFIRGVPLAELTRGFSFPVAAAVTSGIFGLVHLGNPGEQAFGIANAVLVGVVLAYSIRVTGSLWWAIGFHAVWDWMESYLVGTADSGQVSAGRLMVASPTGPTWLSGGTVGPEGSALCTVALIVVLIGLFALRGRFTPIAAPVPSPTPAPA